MTRKYQVRWPVTVRNEDRETYHFDARFDVEADGPHEAIEVVELVFTDLLTREIKKEAMTNDEGNNLLKALREHAGECWRVDMLRSGTHKEWEVRIVPNYYGVVVITKDMLEASRSDPADLLKAVMGQLDTMRASMLQDLWKGLP